MTWGYWGIPTLQWAGEGADETSALRSVLRAAGGKYPGWTRRQRVHQRKITVHRSATTNETHHREPLLSRSVTANTERRSELLRLFRWRLDVVLFLLRHFCTSSFYDTSVPLPSTTILYLFLLRQSCTSSFYDTSVPLPLTTLLYLFLLRQSCTSSFYNTLVPLPLLTLRSFPLMTRISLPIFSTFIYI